ncbi:MAG TPA: ABC transporter permease [Nocardioidaceae bacterium]|nr:ABC transporter permease [Nocardioidaceae bacterium]
MTDLTGTGTLFRLAARRDRVAIPVWVLSIAAMVALTASSLKRLYPTRADLVHLAATVADNPAVVAIRGQARGLDTIGGTTAWQVGWFAMLAAALMSLLLVVRHTRGDEETARMELLLAQPVGRYAALAAAMAIVVVANVAIAVAVAAAMTAYGAPVGGSVALGTSIAGAGLVFGAVAAVTAQFATTGRAASGLAGAALGIAYVMRAVGDVKHDSVGWLTWVSPLGWAEEMRPFAGDRWWPLAILLVVASVLVLGAVRRQGARDYQAGLIAPRPGPPRASRLLTTPLGLAVRVERGTFAGWAAGGFAIGFAYGSIGNSVKDIIDTSSQLQEVFIRGGGDVVDAFFSTTSMVLALIATGFAVQAVLRMRADEAGGLAEPILATALSRTRWAASHVAVGLAGAVALTAIAGLGTGLAYALQGGEAIDIGRLTWAAVVQTPAVWVVGALTLVLFGLIPRISVPIAWSVLGGCVVVSFVGPLLGLPDWVSQLSPYDHIPKLPAAPFSAWPLLALTGIAAVLTAVGLAGLRRRDIG